MRRTLCFLVSKLIVGLRDHKIYIYIHIYITFITIYLIIYIKYIKLNRYNHFLVFVTACKLYKYWILNLHSKLTAREIICAVKIVRREVVTKNMSITRFYCFAAIPAVGLFMICSQENCF